MSIFFKSPIGLGISYRKSLLGPIEEEFFRSGSNFISALEIMPEHFTVKSDLKNRRILDKLSKEYNLTLHGTKASLWSTAGTKESFIEDVKSVASAINPPYYSDHCAMTRTPTIELGHLSPNKANPLMLQTAKRNIRNLSKALQMPIVVENITYQHRFSNDELSPEDFFLRLVNDVKEIGVLLDVTNLLYNSVNHNFEAKDFIDNLPLDRVVHIHLAGGIWRHWRWIDSHSQPVDDSVFELLEYVVSKCKPDAFFIERDNNVDDYMSVAEDLKKIHNIVEHCLN